MEFYTKYHKVVWAVFGCLVLFTIIAYTVTYVDSCRFKSGIEKQKEEVNTLIKQSENINATIANLEQQKKEIDVKAAEANANLEVLKNETNKAQDETNKSLDNLNMVNSTNFNGTGLSEAERRRCKAYPNTDGCFK